MGKTIEEIQRGFGSTGPSILGEYQSAVRKIRAQQEPEAACFGDYITGAERTRLIREQKVAKEAEARQKEKEAYTAELEQLRARPTRYGA